MRRFHNNITFLHVAALWLLVVSVFFGPIGLGSTAAFPPAPKAGGVSCPCETDEHDRHAGEHRGHPDADPCDDSRETNSGHDEGDPCQDECPDDCPKCNCCLGAAMAVLPLSQPSSADACASSDLLEPMDVPPSGFLTNVFRPPRSLS